MDVGTIVRTEKGQAITCRATNISAAGFSAEASLPIGARVEAQLVGLGTVWAQVRWSIGGRSGLAFADPEAETCTSIARLLTEARSARASIMWSDLPS